MCILKKLQKAWEDYQAKKEAERRKQDILEKCGCVVYCPNCKEPLNDNSDCKELDKDGLVEYTCVKCQTKSIFHFGIAPVPIYMED